MLSPVLPNALPPQQMESFVVVILTTKNSPPCLRPGGMIDQNTESIENS
eukprot:COSAG01_NODE_47288_length_391_cov_462.222603_1_plen_48_part_10